MFLNLLFLLIRDPTPFEGKDFLFGIDWRPTTADKMEYLSINTTNHTSVMLSNYRQRESEFWNNYIHVLMKKDDIPATYCQPEFQSWEDQKYIYEASLFGSLGAVGLFLILSVICCCLYCRAKR